MHKLCLRFFCLSDKLYICRHKMLKVVRLPDWSRRVTVTWVDSSTRSNSSTRKIIRISGKTRVPNAKCIKITSNHPIRIKNTLPGSLKFSNDRFCETILKFFFDKAGARKILVTFINSHLYYISYFLIIEYFVVESLIFHQWHLLHLNNIAFIKQNSANFLTGRVCAYVI